MILSQTLTRKRPFQTTNKVPLFSAASPSFSMRFVQMMNNYGATVLVPEVDSDLKLSWERRFLMPDEVARDLTMRVFSPGPKYLAFMKVESFSFRISKLVETTK